MPSATAVRETRKHCVNHPDRLPVGRCAKCSAAACAECVSRLDGILHCRDCLRAAAATLERKTSGGLARIGTALLAVVLLLPAIGVALAGMRVLGMLGESLTHQFGVEFDSADDGAR